MRLRRALREKLCHAHVVTKNDQNDLPSAGGELCEAVMSVSLIPDYVFNDYTAVTPAFLRDHGVRLLLSDLDYTLAPKAQAEPDENLLAWVRTLKDSGVTVEIISNNRSPVRVERFCKNLGIDYVGNAGKPGTRGLVEAMRKHGVCAAQTAMLGDKLLTDTLAAKRGGTLMLMVEPKDGPVGAWNHVLHAMQEPFKRACGQDQR